MQKGGTVAEFAIWEHCVHTQRCKLTPIARDPLNVKESSKFSGCLGMVVYFHSSFSQHMLKYTVACFPKHGRLCHPAKMRDWASRKALFRPPSSKTTTLTSASQVPCPHGATLQPAISQLCLLKLTIQNRGKNWPWIFAHFKACFQMHFSSAKAPWVTENVQLRGFGKNSPDANFKQRAMTLSSTLFNKQSTLLNSNKLCPALWKLSWYIVKSGSACNYSCLRPSLERWALTLVPFVLSSVCGSVQHSPLMNGWSDEKCDEKAVNSQHK